ncbi:hypothetical protein [Streptomyces sp. NRRL F-2580]|uniref:hypothetical protein n=1 Tax=Streptomyces sp. NRRL F-2580 TaxID=1463841 RepID=UPI0004C51F5A|nr:hypothetical protein [Streptomyces sp. NRRL F-2580]
MWELDRFEDELIEQYRRHPVLANIERLPEEAFAEILLQRRFLSLAFTPAYDLAIDLLQDEAGLRIARMILREEYPDDRGNTTSHREDMTDDMHRLGISRTALVRSRPTAATKRTIEDTFALIAEEGDQDHADLRLLTVLRFWGEILVSVEYGRLWERMEPLLVRDGENHSRFYYPHHYHDAKKNSLETVNIRATSHSDRLGNRLRQLIGDGGATADCFKEAEQRSLRLKVSFYDQFLPALERVGS